MCSIKCKSGAPVALELVTETPPLPGDYYIIAQIIIVHKSVYFLQDLLQIYTQQELRVIIYVIPMKRGHVTSSYYYYFNIVKMAAFTVEMAVAMFILPPVFFIGDKMGNRRVPGITKQG